MSGNGGVKCQCGRSFKTPAAMKQHKASGMCRGKVGPAPKPQRANPRRAVMAGAPVSQAVEVRETGTDSAVVSGVDRLEHIEDISKYAHGTVVLDDLISASSFARLSKIAGAYQKVRFRKLQFRVVPMIPTSVGGGYVVAFVRDPADVPPSDGNDLLNWVTSQQGSVTTKWWQNSAISVPLSDRTYYTSSSEEIREYSPGRLVIVVDGKASSSGPVTVFVDWSVTLTHASLESTIVPGRPDHTVALRNLWTKDTNTYVWSYDPTKTKDSGSPNPEYMFSDWAVGDLFMLPSAFTLMEYKSGQTGDSEVENFWVLHVESETGVRWRIHPDTTDSGRAAADDVLIIPRGAVLRRVEQAGARVQGEALRRGFGLRTHSLSPSVEASAISGSKSVRSLRHSRTECRSGIPLPHPVDGLTSAGSEAILRELLTEFRHFSLSLGAESAMRCRACIRRDDSPFEPLGADEAGSIGEPGP